MILESKETNWRASTWRSWIKFLKKKLDENKQETKQRSSLFENKIKTLIKILRKSKDQWQTKRKNKNEQWQTRQTEQQMSANKSTLKTHKESKDKFVKIIRILSKIEI